jgi:hypothetical protein
MFNGSRPGLEQAVLFDEVPAQQQICVREVAAYVYDEFPKVSTNPSDMYGAAANDIQGFTINGVKPDIRGLSLRP